MTASQIQAPLVAPCVQIGSGSIARLARVPVTIDAILVADAPDAWRSAGFTVDSDDVCRIGDVRVRLLGAVGHGAEGNTRGIVGWCLRDMPPDADLDDGMDGLPTSPSSAPPCEPATHPNGAVRIDHLVVMSPDLDRTTKALEAIAVTARRVRDFDIGATPMRQVFFRFGPVILEVVGRPDEHGDGPSTFWGLTHAVTELDATARLLGDGLGRIKDAVQPGRRIATLRHRELGLSVATAFITLVPN